MMKISNKFLHTTIIVFAVVLCVTSVLKTYPFADAQVPAEYYFEGENVNLNGDFMLSSVENTDGYIITLEQTELISYENMMMRYGYDSEYLGQNSRFDIVLITLNIQNIDNIDGCLLLKEFRIINKWKNIDYGIDNTLLPITETSLNDTYSIAIRPGTEYTITLPYSLNKRRIDGINKIEIDDMPLYLRVSAYPTKKFIILNEIQK